jgi:ABC-type Zn2+ transport system substrate-binding protein/surface adhesin
LYLAKIYNKKDDKKKEQQNLDTVLLIEPSNEEAILMIMQISLEKSNYSKVQKLSETFEKVCKNLCDENDKIKESLKNIESKNES